jgi:lysozyme
MVFKVNFAIDCNHQNLLDFGWRQYDPVIARWHVTDPAGQFYNPYLAIGANPVSLIDPDGRKTHSGMSGTSTKPFDMVLLPDIENGLGGWGGGGGMGIGSLASLSPYDMQKLQLASGTAIASEYKNGNMHMSAGTFGHTLNDGAVVLTNANSGTAFSVIDGANTNYGVVNGQVVDLNLTQPITETYDYSYGQVTETFNNYITVQQGGGATDLSQRGLEFIARFEGFESNVYFDVAGIPTIGFGHVVLPGEDFSSGITRERALVLLRQDVQAAINKVNRHITVDLTQNQFDAVVSFTFNVGMSRSATPSLINLVNSGNYNSSNVFNTFGLYNRAGGRVINGLTRRRAAEANLFLYGY